MDNSEEISGHTEIVNKVTPEFSDDKNSGEKDNKSDRFFKYFTLIVGGSFIALCIYAFIKSNNNPTANSDEVIKTVDGEWFLQPQNRNLSLSMVTLKTTITINFLDTVYCNINISSAAGNVALSRTYKFDDGRIYFNDPTTGSQATYETGNVNKDEESFFMTNSKGTLMFKAFAINQNINELLQSENTLKRDEFLYPALNVKERAGSHFDEVNGRLHEVDTVQTTDINLYKLF